MDDPRPWLVGFSGGKDSTLDRMRRFSQQHQLNIESLGKQKRMLGVIFRKAQNKFQDPARLRRLDRIARKT